MKCSTIAETAVAIAMVSSSALAYETEELPSSQNEDSLGKDRGSVVAKKLITMYSAEEYWGFGARSELRFQARDRQRGHFPHTVHRTSQRPHLLGRHMVRLSRHAHHREGAGEIDRRTFREGISLNRNSHLHPAERGCGKKMASRRVGFWAPNQYSRTSGTSAV